MRDTERYTIAFGGLPEDINHKYNIEKMWNTISHEVAVNTGIYIDAIVREETIVCSDTNQCNGIGILGILIYCVRNPVINPDEKLFHETISAIITRLKNELGDPYAAVMVDEIQFSFFIKR